MLTEEKSCKKVKIAVTPDNLNFQELMVGEPQEEIKVVGVLPIVATARVTIQKPYTIVELVYKDTVLSIGIAKYNPEDKNIFPWNKEFGIQVALGRAVKRLERQTCRETEIVEINNVLVGK